MNEGSTGSACEFVSFSLMRHHPLFVDAYDDDLFAGFTDLFAFELRMMEKCGT